MEWEKRDEFLQAVQKGNKETIQALLKESPELIKTTNDNGYTPLHITLHSKPVNCRHGRSMTRTQSIPDDSEEAEPILSLLLPFAKEHGVIDDVSKDGTNSTALYVAVEKNRPVAIKLLLMHGANPWAPATFSGQDSNKLCRMWSPISCAFAKTSNEMAEVFIDFYQSQRESDGRDDVALRQDSDETKDSTEDTPDFITPQKHSLLHSTAAFASSDNLKALIDDFDDTEFIGENTKHEIPLHSAVRSDREATEKFRLLYYEYHYDEDQIGQALAIACKVGAKEIVRFLLQNAHDIVRNEKAKKSLIGAVKAGNMDIVKLLLDKDMNFLPNVNEKKDTALHVAVKAGNKVMVKELLQRWATINKRSEKHRSGSKSNKSNTNSVSTAPLIEPKMFDKIFGANEDGENPLTLAVKSNERAIAKMLLEKGDWQLLMRHARFNSYLGVSETPMRLLISEMPEIAELVLDKCREDEKDNKVKFNVEFVNDVETDWYNTQLGDDKSTDRSHVLNVLLHHQSMDLLDHPVVKVTIKYLGSHARNTFLLSLLTYSIFLGFLTAELFVMEHTNCYGHTSVNAGGSGNNDSNTTVSPDPDDYETTTEYIVLGFLFVVSGINLVVGIARAVFYWKSEHSLIWSVALQCLTYILTMIHIVFAYNTQTHGVDLRYSMGVLVFLGWMNFMILIRRLPVFGIYVIMFGNVCVSFVKFSLVFTVMLIAFAMSFYALFCSHKAFRHIGWVFMKTGVMMTGELDYGDQWVNPDVDITSISTTAQGISIFMYCIFLILMTILLMNMLVGLAVNDIAEVQRYSQFTVLKTEIDHAINSKRNLASRLCRTHGDPKPIPASITMSREKEMIIMGDLRPIMCSCGGWQRKGTGSRSPSTQDAQLPLSGYVNHGADITTV